MRSPNTRADLSGIRTLILDWSGTLVDDLPAVWAATNHCLEQGGEPILTEGQFRSEFELPFTRFYQRKLPHVPVSQLEKWFIRKFAEVQDSVEPILHAEEFLRFCRASGFRTVLFSAIHPEHFTSQARAIGFDQWLDQVHVGIHDKCEALPRWFRDHGVDPATAAFVGDMEHDVAAAKAAGIRSIAVLTGYNSLDQLRAATPHLIVEHLGELQQLMSASTGSTSGQGQDPSPRRPIATVGGVIVNQAGHILMIRTRKWSDLWGIPGGKIEWGESSEDALRRELFEETGLQVSNIRFVLVQDCIHSPEFYRDAHFLLLNYLCTVGGDTDVCLNDEGQDFRWLSVDAAFGLPLNQPTRFLLQEIQRRNLLQSPHE